MFNKLLNSARSAGFTYIKPEDANYSLPQLIQTVIYSFPSFSLNQGFPELKKTGRRAQGQAGGEANAIL